MWYKHYQPTARAAAHTQTLRAYFNVQAFPASHAQTIALYYGVEYMGYFGINGGWPESKKGDVQGHFGVAERNVGSRKKREPLSKKAEWLDHSWPNGLRFFGKHRTSCFGCWRIEQRQAAPLSRPGVPHRNRGGGFVLRPFILATTSHLNDRERMFARLFARSGY